MQTLLIVAGCVWFLLALIFVGALCFVAQRKIPGLETETEPSGAQINSAAAAPSAPITQPGSSRAEEFPFIDSIANEATS